MTIEVVIDRERCTGHGRCYTVAPEIFESDDDGYGTVRAIRIPVELLDAARLGMINCPEDAITVTTHEETV